MARQARRGRPRLPVSKKKQESLSFRPTVDTRAKLEAAAEAEGHSLSAEVERRLTLSFVSEPDRKEALHLAFGGPHNYALGFLVARVACAVEHCLGRQWGSDNDTLRGVGTALIALLQRMRAIAPEDQLHCPLVPGSESGHLALSACNKKWGDQHLDQFGLRPWFVAISSIEKDLKGGVVAWPLTGGAVAAASDPRAFGVPAADALQRLLPLAQTPRNSAKA